MFGRIIKLVLDRGTQFQSQFEVYCSRKNICHEMSSVYTPSSNSHSELRVKWCKGAVRRADLTGGDAHSILNKQQELVLSNCNASSKELFLKRRIKSSSFLSMDNKRPFSWDAEILLREHARLGRQEKGQNLAPVRGYEPGQRCRVQEKPLQRNGPCWGMVEQSLQ